MKSLFRLGFVCLTGFMLVGCVSIKTRQSVKTDGSTKTIATVSFDESFLELLKQADEAKDPMADFCDSVGEDLTEGQKIVSCSVRSGSGQVVTTHPADYYHVEDKDTYWLFTFPDDWSEDMIDQASDSSAQSDTEAGVQMLKAMGFNIETEITFPGDVQEASIGRPHQRKKEILIINMDDIVSMESLSKTPTVKIAKGFGRKSSRRRIRRNTLNLNRTKPEVEKKKRTLRKRPNTRRGSNLNQSYRGPRRSGNSRPTIRRRNTRTYHHASRPSKISPLEKRYFQHYPRTSRIPRTRFDPKPKEETEVETETDTLTPTE